MITKSARLRRSKVSRRRRQAKVKCSEEKEEEDRIQEVLLRMWVEKPGWLMVEALNSELSSDLQVTVR